MSNFCHKNMQELCSYPKVQEKMNLLGVSVHDDLEYLGFLLLFLRSYQTTKNMRKEAKNPVFSRLCVEFCKMNFIFIK